MMTSNVVTATQKKEIYDNGSCDAEAGPDPQQQHGVPGGLQAAGALCPSQLPRYHSSHCVSSVSYNKA